MIKVENLGRIVLESFAGLGDFSKFNISFIGLGQAGGNIVESLARAGHYAIAVNTATTDLGSLDDRFIPNDPYHRIHLDGYEGSAGNPSIGEQAVMNNLDKLQEYLATNERLINSDFVFIVGSLGGGTGSGSMPVFLEAMSSLLPPSEYGNRVGAIVVIPSADEGERRLKNVYYSLKRIFPLIQNNVTGAIIPIENERLIQIYKESDLERIDLDLNFKEFGNVYITQIITEIALATTISSSTQFDYAEFLEVIGKPGWLSIDKIQVPSLEINETLKKQEFKRLFTSPTLTSGFDSTALQIGSFLVIQPKNEGFSEEAIVADVNKFAKEISDNNCELIHSGIIKPTNWQMIGSNQAIQRLKKSGIDTDTKKILLYSLLNYHPEYGAPYSLYNIISHVEQLIEEEKEKNEKLASRKKGLSFNKDVTYGNQNTVSQPVNSKPKGFAGLAAKKETAVTSEEKGFDLLKQQKSSFQGGFGKHFGKN